MKGSHIVIGGLTVISALFFIGWVLPEYPYTRRLSQRRAEELLNEYTTILTRYWEELQNSEDRQSVIPKNENDRLQQIEKKLTAAGYRFLVEFDGYSNSVKVKYIPPNYIKEPLYTEYLKQNKEL